MNTFVAPDLTPVIPEIWMAVLALAMLMIGVFRDKNAGSGFVSNIGLAGLAIAMVLIHIAEAGTATTFGGQFIVDPFSTFLKTIILLGSAATLVVSGGYLQLNKIDRFEYPVLIVLSTLGMMMMVSANDLLSLYVGLELQSLALYVLAAFKRDNTRSTEAGLKYFVLGAIGSGMLLYGSSLVYGFTGATGFEDIAAVIGGQEKTSMGIVIGLVFIMAAMAFKVSAAPFHMWTPDVYEGAPTPVTAFFSVTPKVAAMGLFMRVTMDAFGGAGGDWTQIVVFVAGASMLVGSFAALRQTNIKRLMAYSSIGHVGFMLMGLATGTVDGLQGILLYAAIYLAMTMGTFACILALKREGVMDERIESLAGLSKTNPMQALMLGIFMFSMAGIPPFGGFFGKFYVFMAALDAGYMILAVFGVLLSVVSAYYYLRIVKIMYFDEPVYSFEKPAMGLKVVSGLAALFISVFVLMPGPLLSAAQAAASSILQ